MVSVCLPSDAFLQHLPSYLGFSYLGHGVSLHGCSSKAQPLLLTLAEEYLLTAAPSDLERGIATLGPPVPAGGETLGWKKHKLESRLLGEISITSDMQMTSPLWQKVKRN